MKQSAWNCFLLIPPPLRSSSYLRRTAPSGGSRILERKQSAWNCFLLIPPPLRSSSYLRRTAPSGGSRHLERKPTGRNCSTKIGELPERVRGMKHNLRRYETKRGGFVRNRPAGCVWWKDRKMNYSELPVCLSCTLCSFLILRFRLPKGRSSIRAFG